MLTNQIQQKALPLRQECFVKNIFANESTLNSNSMMYQRKKSEFQSNLRGKKVGEKSLEKCSLSVRRSYGSMNFNNEDKVQLNNRGSIQDYVICSDAIIKNEKKKQVFIQLQKERKTSQEKQLRKFPVNVKHYNQYLKTEQIADAYYYVDRQVEQARKRETKKYQTIKKVQSLSRSKSKEQNLQFRNKEKLNFNCVKHVQELKQKYAKKVVPELMGTQSQSNKQISTSDKNLLSIKTTNTIQTHQIQHPQNNIFNAKQSQSQFFSRAQTQIGFFDSAKPTQSTSLMINSQQKPSIYTSRMLKESKKQLKGSKSKSINPDSLMKNLQKSKSTEQFIQKQRVKVIKQAFIQNWRQGQNKQYEKYLKIYPCKYTQQVNQQKQRQKESLEKHKKQQMYGQKYFKKNPIENLPEKSPSGDMLVQRYNTLKQYQLEFVKIGKNNVKSCVVAKN